MILLWVYGKLFLIKEINCLEKKKLFITILPRFYQLEEKSKTMKKILCIQDSK